MKAVKIDIKSTDVFRRATSDDIKEGNMVFLVGDDNFLHRFMVDEVLRPDDEFKAFVADDGCRYGLSDLYVLKSSTELHAKIKYLTDKLKAIKQIL